MMKLPHLLVAAAFALSFGIAGAAAHARTPTPRALTTSEEASLEKAAAAYAAALAKRDASTLAAMAPRDYLAVIAERNDLELPGARTLLREELGKAGRLPRLRREAIAGADFAPFVSGFRAATVSYALRDAKRTFWGGNEVMVLAVYDLGVWRFALIETQIDYEIMLEAYPTLLGAPVPYRNGDSRSRRTWTRTKGGIRY
ncbi:MAG: hypothetical protein MRY74_11490 [Neomegalonema sp.]|nr:hypothetical protein [Neomegalonema sp.]